MGRHVAEVTDRHLLVTDLNANGLHLLMRQLEKFVEQPKLVDQLKRGRMDGVAAEIAQKILVLFQHDHIDPGASQKETEHHAGRAAAGNATGGVDGFY